MRIFLHLKWHLVMDIKMKELFLESNALDEGGIDGVIRSGDDAPQEIIEQFCKK